MNIITLHQNHLTPVYTDVKQVLYSDREVYILPFEHCNKSRFIKHLFSRTFSKEKCQACVILYLQQQFLCLEWQSVSLKANFN